MSLITIEPHDLLIVRDGRPKGESSVGQALPFPLPPTVAGGVRTRLGSLPGKGFVAGGQLDALKAVTIRGPLLMSLDDQQLFLLPPRDALMVRDAKTGAETLRRLRPLADTSGVVGNFADGLSAVGLSQPEHRAAKAAPMVGWWSWALMESWLRGEADATAEEVRRGRVEAMPTEGRMHVRVGTSGTADDGALFETRGMRFVSGEKAAQHRPLTVSRYAMTVDIDDATVPAGMTFRDETAPFGGERRPMRWARASGASLPAVPEWLKTFVRAGEACTVRVVLATPGHFRAGARPSPEGPLLSPREALTVTLKAMAVGRPETFSGWDFTKPRGGAPKASERAVPAGSVYWIELAGRPEARLRWLESVWMQNVSDDVQRRCDGLGLALVGRGQI